MKKNKVTEVVFIIDASGSMSTLCADALGSINTVLEEKRNTPYDGKIFITMVMFNNFATLLRDKTSIRDVPPLTEKEYVPKGLTALYDAIGETIEYLEKRRHRERTGERYDKTLCFIMTDGMENASRRFDRATVKEMLEDRQGNGWEFVFLASNIDAEESARHIGISKERAIGWHADGMGLRGIGRGMSRCMESVIMEDHSFVREDFSEADEDFKRRKK